MYDYLAKVILLGPSGCGKYGTLLSQNVHAEPSVLDRAI